MKIYLTSKSQHHDQNRRRRTQNPKQNNPIGYRYLGDWQYDRENSNIEEEYLKAYLQRQGYADAVINKAIFEFKKIANDFSENLYTTSQQDQFIQLFWYQSRTTIRPLLRRRYHLAHTRQWQVHYDGLAC